MIDLRPTEVTAIGRITENAGSVRLLDKTGAEVELSGAGWDHLRTEVTERS
jgi:hypothetical protein